MGRRASSHNCILSRSPVTVLTTSTMDQVSASCTNGTNVVWRKFMSRAYFSLPLSTVTQLSCFVILCIHQAVKKIKWFYLLQKWGCPLRYCIHHWHTDIWDGWKPAGLFWGVMDCSARSCCEHAESVLLSSLWKTSFTATGQCWCWGKEKAIWLDQTAWILMKAPGLLPARCDGLNIEANCASKINYFLLYSTGVSAEDHRGFASWYFLFQY